MQKLQGTNRKANSQYDDKTKFMSKSNGNFFYKPLSQTRPYNLDGSGRSLNFVISK